MAGAIPVRSCASSAEDIRRAGGLACRLQVVTGYDAVRIVPGLLLCTAAVSKGHQLARELAAETSLLIFCWLRVGSGESESFFSMWLSAGVLPKPTCTVALSHFGLFACAARGSGSS